MRKVVVLVLSLLPAVLVPQAFAVIDITVTEGVEQPLPVAVVPFGWSGPADSQPIFMESTIGNDLARSGRFAPMEAKDMPQTPTEFAAVNFKDWRMLGMQNVVIGSLRETGPDSYEVEFRLLNSFNGSQLAGFRVPATRKQLRRTAHRIADIVFEKLTGVRGAFDTRIAYVTVKKTGSNSRYSLQIADADGFNPQVLLESDEPLLSPAWAPDGKRLAYVSFEGRTTSVYVQDIITGQRQKVAANPGINSAPAFSPDGRRLALTLSMGGDPEIYVLNLETRGLYQVTHDRSIDTEPSWSPDGSRIAFTSDRGGGPQIYEASAQGGPAQRLSFEGSYNARPRYAPDGRSIAVVHGRDRRYQIGVFAPGQGGLEILSKSRLDESPSFAPNGSMIIYTTVGARGSELAAVSTDGHVHQRLALQDGEVREPAWGPFLSGQ
ncbi:MAG: Tol-Pal system beta propeller repeat protein TolB [Gammaproteobacteria bacterium]|nr:Tol-Pal system beta propeller repeat protein TolB [Gammaproteobacteria bacterium]